MRNSFFALQKCSKSAQNTKVVSLDRHEPRDQVRKLARAGARSLLHEAIKALLSLRPTRGRDSASALAASLSPCHPRRRVCRPIVEELGDVADKATLELLRHVVWSAQRDDRVRRLIQHKMREYKKREDRVRRLRAGPETSGLLLHLPETSPPSSRDLPEISPAPEI